MYLDCSIAGFGTGGVVLPIPPLCQKFVPKRIVSIVVGLCRLWLNCMIAGFVTGGVLLPIPSLCQQFVPKKIGSIAFGLCGLNLDCSDCMWINTRPEADL